MRKSGTEAIGTRIITLPQDPARQRNRDAKSGFIAYLPPGSIKKGEDLVKTGGGGKTNGERTGANAQLMKGPVAQLTDDDIVAISADLGSLAPAP